MKKLLPTILLALVLAGLAIYTIYFNQPAKTETEKYQVLQFNRDTVKELSVSGAGEKLVFAKVVKDAAKKDFSWEITAPKRYQADTVEVNMVLNQLAELQADKVTEIKQGDLSQFGLDKPQTKVEITFDDGTKKELLFGTTSPVNSSNYYGATQDKDVVFLLPDYLYQQLNRGIKDFRNKDLAEVPEDIIYLSVVIDGKAVEMAKKNDKWQLLQPKKADLETSQVDSYLVNLRFLRTTDFPNDNPSPEDIQNFGLDKPWMEISFRDNQSQETRISFGKQNEQGEYFARSSSQPVIYTVGQDQIKRLKEDLEDLIGK